MNKAVFSFKLAKADMYHEWALSLALVLAISALLTPVFVLQGVKDGVVQNMLDKLHADPRSRELQPVGQGNFAEQFFRELSDLQGVSYLIPATRYLAAPIIFNSQEKSDGAPIAAMMIPSSDGDPLLADVESVPALDKTTVLTSELAQSLGVEVGGVVSGLITRRGENGRYESQSFNFEVVGILKPSSRGDKAALLSRDFVYASEFFREHIDAPFFDYPEKRKILEKDRIFPSFRLYVSSIDDVEPVRDWLSGRGVRVVTEIERINLVKGLDRAFTNVFNLLAIAGGTGMAMALACTFWLNIKRKRKELSTLLAAGFPPFYLHLMTQYQAILLAFCGAVLASGAYFLCIDVVNELFSERFGDIALVADYRPQSQILISAFALVIGVAAAAIASLQISKIEPGEGLRDG